MKAFLVGLCACCALASLWLVNSATAGPVTLRFEAEIVDVDEIRASELSGVFSEGSSFSGEFSFISVDAQAEFDPMLGFIPTSTRTTQTLGLSINLTPFVLHSEEYQLDSFSDFPLIDAQEFLSDQLSLRCDFGGCGIVEGAGGDPFLWRFAMPLRADGTVIDGADLPGDAAIWNQFVPSFFSIRFQDPGIADVLGISARVNSFQVVPEPSTWLIVFTFSAILLLRRTGGTQDDSATRPNLEDRGMKAFLVGLRACCALVLLGLWNSATAAPVTLAFEAEITAVNQEPTPLALPFDVNVGETLHGTITFEPLDVASDVKRSELSQPFNITFLIDGFSFATGEYLAQSFDDILSADDVDFTLPGPSGPSDEIRLKRDLDGDLGDPLNLEWGFAFAFFGDENVLDGADLPADLATWQDFSETSFRLTFVDRSQQNSTIVRTSITKLSAIPEPGSFALAVVGLFLGAVYTAARPLRL